MHHPHYVKLYVHSAKLPRAYQISSLRKGHAPNRCGVYSYRMHRGRSPVPETQKHVKSTLRMIRGVYPL